MYVCMYVCMCVVTGIALCEPGGRGCVHLAVQAQVRCPRQHVLHNAGQLLDHLLQNLYTHTYIHT